MKTEHDYQNKLMDVIPNTKEFEELDILTTLGEAYEDIQYKIETQNLIEVIKFRDNIENDNVIEQEEMFNNLEQNYLDKSFLIQLPSSTNY